MANIRVIWKKSGIGYNESQKRTLRALGLHSLNESVVHVDSPVMRGMINKVRHLVEVHRADEVVS